MFKEEYSTNATSFQQLTNYTGPIRMPYIREFRGDGQCWSVAVPQQGQFAGNYLLTSDGKIHFNPTAAAKINDPDLLDPSLR